MGDIGPKMLINVEVSSSRAPHKPTLNVRTNAAWLWNSDTVSDDQPIGFIDCKSSSPLIISISVHTKVTGCISQPIKKLQFWKSLLRMLLIVKLTTFVCYLGYSMLFRFPWFFILCKLDVNYIHVCLILQITSVENKHLPDIRAISN